MSINKSKVYSEIKSLIFVLFLAFAIKTFAIQIYCVPTGSMKQTILDGDYLLSTKYSYGYSKYSFPITMNLFKGRIFGSQPNQGDIIIMEVPSKNIQYIKRLIGIPGDKVQIINNVIHINNTPIKRKLVGSITDDDGAKYLKYKETLPNNNSYYAYYTEGTFGVAKAEINVGPFYVPENHYFFMGDNRNQSNDSRYDLGYVPFENLIAKAHFIIFSDKLVLFRPGRNIFQDLSSIFSWFKAIRFNRIFKSLYEI
ncbi:MAG: signal peptidase I [Rickettsiaceae bacterium]